MLSRLGRTTTSIGSCGSRFVAVRGVAEWTDWPALVKRILVAVTIVKAGTFIEGVSSASVTVISKEFE